MEYGRVHVLVRGRVQGVFFRASTRDMAGNLNLQGWVRNLPDGSVEAVFEGPKDLLERAVEWCRKGPPGAAVKEVFEEWMGHTGEFDGFSIKYGF